MASASCTSLFCSVSHFLLLLLLVIMLIQIESQICPPYFNFSCPNNVYNGSLSSSHFTMTNLGCGGPCELTCEFGPDYAYYTTIKCNKNPIYPAYRVLHINPNSPNLTIAVEYPDWLMSPDALEHYHCLAYLVLNPSFLPFQSVSLLTTGPGENETYVGCPSHKKHDYWDPEYFTPCEYGFNDDKHPIVYGPYDYGHLPNKSLPAGCIQFSKHFSPEHSNDKGTGAAPTPPPPSPPHVRGKPWKPILTSVVVLLVIAVAALIVIIICWRRRNSKSGLRALPTRIVSLNHTASDLEEGSTNNGVTVFSYAELQEITNNFDPARELGEGGFGVVYHGKISVALNIIIQHIVYYSLHRFHLYVHEDEFTSNGIKKPGKLKDGREVAVKRMFEKNYKQIEQFKNEIQILTNVRHPNLVTLYGSTSRHSRELLLVYDYIPNGTLADHLHGHQSKSVLLLWPTRLNIAIQTASALCYLHHNDIIHRDIKTNNILLDKSFVAKVADFGLSRLFPSDVSHVSTAPQGTPGYLDPEYHQCYHLTDRSDVYSFGVVLVELISSMEAVDLGRERHEVNLANYAMDRIQCCEFGELVDYNLGFEKSFKVRRMTSLVAELAFRCLQHEREVRPSMEEVLEELKRIESVDYDGLEAEEMG